MKVESRVILSFLLFAVIGFVLYRVSFIVTPFIVAIILSYFLHPSICYLEKKKVARSWAVLLVMVIFFTIFILLFYLILPILYEQLMLFAKTVPFYFKIFKTDLYPKIVDFAARYSISINSGYEYLSDPKVATKFVKKLSSELFSSSAGVVNFFSLVFIVPILIFYLLKDWDAFRSGFYGHIPSSFYDKFVKLLKDIDASLSGYMRGQAVVCLIMAGVYSALLLLANLDFAILIGSLTGIFTFVPYIGALAGFFSAIIIALFQWGFSFVDISLVVVAFLVGQFLESNFLTPRLIGERVGLHPVWIIFGIFAFGALFGFVGVLLAMPLTAVVSVVIKDLVFEYKKRYVNK